MTIHNWKHWFWITQHTCRLSPVLTVLALHVSALAALDVPSSAGNISHSADREVTLEPPTSQAPNIVQAEDVDDTFYGRNFDSFPIFPISKLHGKQYVDRTTGKKYRIKPKTEEPEEKLVRITQSDQKVNVSYASSSSTSQVSYPPTESSANVTDDDHETDLSEEISVLDVNSTASGADDLVVSTVTSLESESKVAVAAATSVDHKAIINYLDAGAITGIALAIVVLCGLLGAVSFVIYRRRYSNKPQVLNDKSSTLDSSGYIDDASLRVGMPLPLGACMRYKDNSEEMYSLDNDSFLNSLEAMTIQNYWTENVKHTKL